jgi:lysophospholipase L1-like esterase
MRSFKIFFIAVIIVITIVLISACASLYKPLARIISVFNFNYPGLRLETRIFQKTNDAKIIGCFGDSVTFGWNMRYVDSFPFLLDMELNKTDFNVLNLGIGGNTIIDAYHRVQRDVIKYEPYIVFINFGLNDGMLAEVKESYYADSTGYSCGAKQYAPNIGLTEFEKYYKKVIDAIIQSGSEVVVIGINPVTDEVLAGESQACRALQKQVYKIYNEKIKEIAEEKNLSYIDLWDYFNEMEDLTFFMDKDGLHPNQRGSYAIFEKILLSLKDSEKIITD